MYRVYCLIGSYRYYWAGSHWVQWSWAAKPLPLAKALEVSIAQDAEYEEYSSQAA